MAETAQRREPFDDLAPIEARSRLSIKPAPLASRHVLRGPDEAVQRVGEAFGLALPRELNRAAAGEGRAAFRIGPDEWLLVGPEGMDLTSLEAGGPVSLVDVSHRNVALLVSGPLAADVLASGVMLDLDPAAFPVGMATRTLFTKAEIVLWRRDADTFHVEVWRSFAPYLHGLLAEAAREYLKG